MSISEPLLKIEEVTHRFGGLVALKDVSITVQEGEIRGIIGPNGAGKTTLFNVTTGEIKPTSGKVYFREQDITGLPPQRICKLGLGRTFQMTLIFPGMSVFESIWVGVNAGNPIPWHPLKRIESMQRERERVFEIATMVGLQDKLNHQAANLSYGDQKVLEIALALSTNPALLLLSMNPLKGSARRKLK